MPFSPGPILTKLGTKLSINSGFMNPENYDDCSYNPDFIIYKKRCPYVSILVSVAHFSATAWSIWTMLGRKVGTVSAFISSKNQDDQSHTTDSIL